MKSIYRVLNAGVLVTLVFFTSCVTMSWQTPNWDSILDDLPADVSNYYDYKIENCKLPDGNIADMYVFNNVNDLVHWQNAQERIFNPEFKEFAKQRISELRAHGVSEKDWLIRDYYCFPTGPITPFWRAVHAVFDKTGDRDFTKYTPSYSYYTKEDSALGNLSQLFQSSPNFAGAAAVGCYEDSTGVYLFTICPVKNMAGLQKNKAVQKEHKGQFVYAYTYIPKKMYEDKLVKLNPAKTTRFDPTSFPDSDRNFAPVLPAENTPYYYDAEMANNLQWLAVKVACKGVYDMAYTGDFRAKNPTDYYKTSFIKKYLASDDGRASKGTTLFEGICFDYADFAYQELKTNKSSYPKVANFWMVGTFSDSNDIVSYRIAERYESSNMKINGTPVVVNSHNHVRSHDSATNHAWFWVQSTDGTVYWVDPTWTDNTGRPVYGIVRAGQEIQLEPNSSYCVR